MVSLDAVGTRTGGKSETPTLPPNVSIFSPVSARNAKILQNSLLFTRLALGAQTQPTQLANVSKDKRLDEAYALCHGNFILIFDSSVEGEDTQDKHHEHFRAVCLALKDNDVDLNVASCIFDATTALQAGFQFDELSDGAIMVIDLMDGEDSGDDSDDEGQPQFFSVDEDVEPSQR